MLLFLLQPLIKEHITWAINITGRPSRKQHNEGQEGFHLKDKKLRSKILNLLFNKPTITQLTLKARQAASTDVLPNQETAILRKDQSSKFLMQTAK